MTVADATPFRCTLEIAAVTIAGRKVIVDFDAYKNVLILPLNIAGFILHMKELSKP